jgi:hypothetical protein
MHNDRSPSQTLKYLLICSFSVLALFLGFFTNYWRVADQPWFDHYEHDMESFIVGRMVKSHQDGIFSSGGLTGIGIDAYSEASFNNTISTISKSNLESFTNQYNLQCYTNQYVVYTNNFTFVTFTTYNSQIGGQGMLFSVLNKLIPFLPQEKLRLFNALTSLFSALTLTAIVLWFYLEFGLTVALSVLASALLSQWLVVFGRNLWWSMWSFYLPVAIIMHYLRFKRELIKPFPFGAVVFITVLIKCLFTGYEYVTTTLVMMIVPLVYYGILQGLGFRRFLTGLFTAAFSSLLAIMLTFLILCFQIGSVQGHFVDGVNHIVYSFAKRTSGNIQGLHSKNEYAPSLEARAASSPQVVYRYLRGTFFNGNNYLYCSNQLISDYLLKVHYLYLIILFIIMSGLLHYLRNRCVTEKEQRKHHALIFTTWFSVLAPLSWFIVFKEHSYEHMHMDYIVWQMPFVFFGFAVCGLVVKSLSPNLIRLAGNPSWRQT